MDQAEVPKGRRLLPEPPSVASTALASVIGGSGPGVMAMAATGSPLAIGIGVVGPWAIHGVSKLYQLRTEKSLDRLVTTTSERLGIDVEDLTQRIIDAGDDGVPLFIAAVEAAARTADEQKIDIFATIWAHGLEEDFASDADAELVATIAELEHPHAQILAMMAARPVDAPEAQLSVNESVWMKPDVIQEALPHLSTDLFPAYMAKVTRLGLVDTSAGFGGGLTRSLSAWGLFVVSYLDEWAEMKRRDSE